MASRAARKAMMLARLLGLKRLAHTAWRTAPSLMPKSAALRHGSWPPSLTSPVRPITLRVMAEVCAGQFWESVGGVTGRARGLCIVVGPNDSRESPGSWVMMRLSDGRTFYMHRAARESGQWIRRTALATAGDVSQE